MNKQTKIRPASIAIIILSIIAGSCSDNWPQFRGADSNMISSSKNLPSEWGDNQNISWKYALEGNGWSSPVIWGDKVFLTAAVLDKSSVKPDTAADPGRPVVNPLDANYRWMVYCIDLNSGELIWERVAFEGKPGSATHNDNTFASETPVTDGKQIYVYFGMTGMYCYDLDGNLVWEKNLGVYKTQGNWGTSSSPVLYKDILYQQLDSEEESFLLALDKHTGEEIWRIPREEKTNWSTPVIWKNSARTELVCGGQKARSYDLNTGEVFWELDLGGGRSTCSPTPEKDMLYIGNEPRRGGGGILFAVKAGAEGDITPEEGDSISSGVLWARPEAGIYMGSPLVYQGLIYTVIRRGGSISCFEASTGKPIYSGSKISDAGEFWASPWANNNKIFCVDGKGATHVIKAGEEFELISTNKIDEKVWSSVAIAGNSIILRGVDNLYCIR